MSKSEVLVLIVDDNELNREIAQGIIEDMGAVVECAGSGQEAIDFAEGKKYDARDERRRGNP